MKIHNFSAGPCILPQSVLKKASDAVLNFNGLGLSILEISHRSPEFVSVIENARSLALELLELDPKEFTVLFLQGGASGQFLMVAQNFLNSNEKAGYLNTGTWSNKSIIEAQRFGEVVEIGSSKKDNYTYIPNLNNIPQDLKYIHYTSNNTIYGTQMKEFPKSGNSLLFCDMSSDIFSRSLNYSQFDLIYAGAQKNIGPAGATMVVLRKSILKKTNRNIPSVLNYDLINEKESMFNTPPVFSIYVSYLNLLWLKDLGGVVEIAKQNNIKQERLYQEIDRNSLFKGVSEVKDRSSMNITFRLNDSVYEDVFDDLCLANGISGIKGHRTVGGYRASLYNALELLSVEKLISTMQDLENKISQ